jgi:oligoribonuclease NrnB/cAMP/cGMP phosphodiesterase (DHH superfamily)
MDGLASAFIAKTVLEEQYEDVEVVEAIPVQYGEEKILLGTHEKIALDKPLTKDDDIYFVDFSLKRDLMIELSSQVNEIIVLDHHKTAKEELKGLEEELDNITIIFDMDKSGAGICFDYFCPNLEGKIFDYIEDRDLWNWNLSYSKEISAAIKFYTKPNDLESFKETYNKFDDVDFANIGEILLKQQEIQVASKIKRVKEIKINDITFTALNATENISEIGNAICIEYNTPALVYFVTENNEVVCSLRSIDSLDDVSTVAKHFQGGGHRNACGFTTHLDHLSDLLEGVSNE